MKYLSVLSCLTSSISLRLAARTFLSTSKRMIVGYATDVEGNVDYWNQYLSVSKVLEKKVVAKNEHIISLKDNCHFVYGGDTCDRGSFILHKLL